MKMNKKYAFWTAKELAEKLLYGTKKEYDFTFDDAESVLQYGEPTGWHGVKLINLFDNHLPNCLAVGYWGGGDTRVFNLEWDDEAKELMEKTDHLAVLITKCLEEYFIYNDAEIACVEL